MSEYGPTYNEIDDYIAELTEAEQEELATADAAIELAFLFHDARKARGLTQAEAARQAGLRQQAVSRFEQPDMKLVNTKLETLRKYAAALNYGIRISLKDLRSGRATVHADLPPRPQQTSFHTIMAPWINWQRGPSTTEGPIMKWESDSPNANRLRPSKGTALVSLPGKGNTFKLSDSGFQFFTQNTEELMETHG